MEYSYEMSNKAFFDAWDTIGKPERITEKNTMDKFFSELMKNTKGKFIVDHITNGNFDRLHSITFEDPYFRIQWKCYEEYRKKYVSKEITDDEWLEWSCFSCPTYDYIICDIRELYFYNLEGHLLIALLLNPIEAKRYEKKLKAKGHNIAFVDSNACFEKTIVFLEGEEKEFKKHICHLNSMPVYSILMQAKQLCTSSYDSMRILSIFMRNWICGKLKEQELNLNKPDYHDAELLSSIGNTCRRLYERYLKFFCVYTHIDDRLPKNVIDKYGYIELGPLKKAINEFLPDEVEQALITELNEFSHDSHVVPTVDDIRILIENTMKSVNSLYGHLHDEIFMKRF